jgi:hypothetical protein
MPVTRKPVPKHPEAAEAKVREFIERGGSVSGEGADDVRTKLVQLRLAPHLVARIDRTRGAELVPPSRHHWILEAIHEKLEREETL